MDMGSSRGNIYKRIRTYIYVYTRTGATKPQTPRSTLNGALLSLIVTMDTMASEVLEVTGGDEASDMLLLPQ